MLSSVLAISLGAAIGAVLRWIFSVRFNALVPDLPLGTLMANLLGGYLIGVIVAWLGQRPDLPPEVRLFLVTGFLGGLTTFSTFSAEVVSQIQAGRLGWALTIGVTHLTGSLLLTALGMATVRALSR
jgi:CrcB protein